MGFKIRGLGHQNVFCDWASAPALEKHFIHSLCKTVLFLFSGHGIRNLWGDATPKLC